MYAATIGGQRLSSLASSMCWPRRLRSGDHLAGVAAGSATERVAAQMALADIPLRQFLNEPVIPYEADEVTRRHCHINRFYWAVLAFWRRSVSIKSMGYRTS